METQPAKAERTKQKRRWSQFSLRTLMIVLLLLNGGFGWFAFKLKQANEQRKVVDSVRKMGGQVFYKYSSSFSGVGKPDSPPAPAWLVCMLGDDFWGNVRRVDIYHNGQITGEKLGCLADLKQLESLALWNDNLTDADLAHAMRLSRVMSLNLGGNKITDAGLAHLANLSQLTSLNLWNNQITDSGVAQLKRLARLSELNLGYNPISNAAIVELEELKKLEVLSLEGTKVTDGGLPSLKRLAKLRSLNLYRTDISEAGVADLRTSVPQCKIVR